MPLLLRCCPACVWHSRIRTVADRPHTARFDTPCCRSVARAPLSCGVTFCALDCAPPSPALSFTHTLSPSLTLPLCFALAFRFAIELLVPCWTCGATTLP